MRYALLIAALLFSFSTHAADKIPEHPVLNPIGEQEHKKAENKQAISNQSSASVMGQIPAKAGQPKSENKSSDKDYRSTREWVDTRAQISMANTAILALFVAIAIGFVAFLQYRMFGEQLRIMGEATKVAAAAAESAKTQAEAIMQGERAYIICGGLYGRDKSKNAFFPRNRQKGYRKATDFEGPWRLQVSNYGRSMGVITKIEWGVCPSEEFEKVKDIRVSQIIETGKLQKWMRKTHEIKEPFPAMKGTDGIPYRHIELPEREIGTVFFGRITYTDIFKKTHHSTFSLLHTREHSDSIGPAYADDWD